MTHADRKAMIAAYKEQKTVAGVFAVICNATGQVWVGKTTHIDTRKNGVWAGLRFGGSPHKALQAAWNEHGEDAFRFEQLDRLPDDLSPMARDTELKSRAGLWRKRLGAEML